MWIYINKPLLVILIILMLTPIGILAFSAYEDYENEQAIIAERDAIMGGSSKYKDIAIQEAERIKTEAGGRDVAPDVLSKYMLLAVKEALLADGIVAESITVTDEELTEFYETHKNKAAQYYAHFTDGTEEPWYATSPPESGEVYDNKVVIGYRQATLEEQKISLYYLLTLDLVDRMVTHKAEKITEETLKESE